MAVRNGGAQHLDKVRAGNEGVLIARYADAAFFFKADSDKKLADFLPRLDTLTFQEKLGSMLDKAKRLEQLAPQIGQMLNLSDENRQTVKRAAHLCKADLATQMVVEFTSLQGVMGYEYALRSGETEAAALAIREHYLPAGAGDALPESDPGAVLSIANRLDSLIGLSAVGLLPSGNKDPFALRREALGLATILMQKGISFPVRVGLEKAAALIPVGVSAETLAETAAFVQRRLEGLLRDQGLPADVVAAALLERGDNPALALEAARDLQNAVSLENWDELLNAYARCVRLVRKLEDEFPFDANLLTEAAEKALYKAWRQTADALTPESHLSDVLEMIAANLIAPINTFFDEVLVMVEDEAARDNRLALLQKIRNLTKGYADFSQLRGF
ncbi:MAG: glycine--tRNA ligase subunit beta [Anaerolineaceae bacterium 4572_5.2]|nr:MAG: glycine--tRNA ligase subunit beta [Anaerolineaceae bacterium 4572_5.2]